MPKGKHDAPGPFYSEGNGVYRMVDGKPDERLDQTSAEEMADLLNKGTHFDGMLEALRQILTEAVACQGGELISDASGYLEAIEGLAESAIAKAEPNVA